MNSSNEMDLIPIESFTGLVQPGSFIASNYTSSGKKVEQGKIYGDTTKVQKMIETIRNHAQRSGAVKEAAPASTSKAVKLPKQLAVPIKEAKSVTPFKRGTKVKGNPTPVPIPTAPPPPIPMIAIPTAPVSQASTIEAKGIDVVFLTDFGTITLLTETVLDCEAAICLIFKNEKEMRFVPKTGSFLSVTIGGTEMKVYFPGIIFTGEDHYRKLMILIKADE